MDVRQMARQAFSLVDVPITLSRLTVLKVEGSDTHTRTRARARTRTRDCSPILGETVRQAAKPQVRLGIFGLLGVRRRGLRHDWRLR